MEQLAQKRRNRACAFNPPYATLPMYRWCFSIGNVAKRAWDQGCAEPQAAPMSASSSRRAAGTLGGQSNRLTFSGPANLFANGLSLLPSHHDYL
jgi:hypothetical protein